MYIIFTKPLYIIMYAKCYVTAALQVHGELRLQVAR